MSGWISVEERLPDADMDVLVWCDTGEAAAARNVWVGWCQGMRGVDGVASRMWVTDEGFVEPTHWMPLPTRRRRRRDAKP